MQDITLMGKVALTRLQRRERIATIAEQSHSPIWRRLARQAINAAQRDCRMAGLNSRTVEAARRRAASRRAA
jgi:hypothetical protein